MQVEYTIFTKQNFDNFILDHSQIEYTRNFPTHTHDICELVYLKKGEITYSIEGKAYRLTKNCLALSRPSQMHSITMNSQPPYDRYNILFDPQILSSDIYGKISLDVDVINFGGNTLVSDLFKKMDYYSENFQGSSLKILLVHLVEEILHNVFLASKNFEHQSVYTVNPFINQAIEYIEEHIGTSVDIDMLCAKLHITRSHLHNLFVEHLKISPKKYIISKKLSIAQRALRAGAKPTEVYLTCGFSDYSTFFRDYKKEFGHAPSEESNSKIVRKIES